MSREAFLARVREAARRGQAHRVHTVEVPADTGYVGAAGDLCVAFAAEVEAIGGAAWVVDDYQAARQRVTELLLESGASSALCWQHPTLADLKLADLLSCLNIERIDYASLAALPQHEQRTLALAADVGITGVQLAIAETGSLVMYSQPGRERMASLLPPMHIAIVHESQIVPDLFDALAPLMATPASELPSNITIITGPSKTGDIELQLTTGVHGPGKWRVIVVRGQVALQANGSSPLPPGEG